MNIYQHLLFLIPITYLLWFGVFRFNAKLKNDIDSSYPARSGIATAAGYFLVLVYGVLNTGLPLRFYNFLGAL